MATPGPLALVSQSGALTSSILDWASQNAVGFSTVVSLGPEHLGRYRAGAGFPGLRPADPQHRGLPRRDLQLAPLHERAAGGCQCQTGGGAQGGSQDRGQPRPREPTRARLWAATTCSMRPCGARVRCGCARSWRCSRPPSAWLPATAQSVVAWRSSPTGAVRGVLAADWISEINLQLGQLSAASAEALKAVLPCAGIAVRPDRPV
jgi:acetyltransferase